MPGSEYPGLAYPGFYWKNAGATVNLVTSLATQSTTVLTVRQVNVTRVAVQAQASLLVRTVNVIRLAVQATADVLVRSTGSVRTVTQAQVARLTLQVNVIRIAAQAATAMLTRQVNAVRIATQATSASQSRVVQVIRIATQGVTASLTRQVDKILIATQATAALLSTTRVALRSLLATQATSALLVRQVGAIRIAAQATADTLVRQVNVVRIAAQSTSAYMTRVTARILLAAQATTATLTRRVNKILIATQATSALVTGAGVALRTLLATQATAALVVRQANVIRIAVQSTADTLTRRSTAVRIATQATSAYMTRVTARILYATQATALQLVKRVSKILIATQATSAVFSAANVFLRALTATQAATATLTRQVNRIATASQAASVTQLRLTARTLLATESQSALVTRRAAITLVATQSQVALVRRLVSVTRIAAQSATASVARGIGQALRAFQNTLASLAAVFVHFSGIPRTLHYSASVGAAVAASPYYFNTVLADAPLAYWRLGEAQADTYLATVLADTPSGFWRLDDTAGTVAVDVSATPHDGTYSGGVTLAQPGATIGGNKSATFNGATGQVVATATAFGTQWSYEIWVFTGTGGSNRFAIRHFPFTLESNGPNGCLIKDNGTLRITGTVQINDSPTWHHMVVTCDGSATRLYVDGVLNVTYAGTINLSAVQVAFSYSGTWSGGLDEAASYAYALTASQVRAHYHAAAVRDWVGEHRGVVYGAVTLGQASNLVDQTTAALFDGATSYINSTKFALTPANGVTVEAWVKKTIGTLGAVVRRLDSAFDLTFLAATQVRMAINANFTAFPAYVYPDDGAWHHLLATFDGATCTLYVDGVQKSTRAQVATITTTAGAVNIGTRDDHGAEFFAGTIDEVAIYNYPLTLARALAHYQAARALAVPVALSAARNVAQAYAASRTASISLGASNAARQALAASRTTTRSLEASES